MRYSEQKIAEAEARGDAVAVAYWQRIAAEVDRAPEFTPAVRDQLRVLLRPRDPVPAAPTQSRSLPPRPPKLAPQTTTATSVATEIAA